MDTMAQHHMVCCELIHSVASNRGEVRLKVTGSSMLPVIWPGDEITVMRCEYSGLHMGEVVLYHRDCKLTAHRIKRIAHDHLVTRGDSLPSYDPPVRPDEIVGRVVSIHRNGRSIQPESSLVSRMVSLILRCSNFSRRIALYLIRHLAHRHSRPLRHTEDRQATWVNC